MAVLPSLGWALALFTATTIAYYLRRGYEVRKLFQSLKKNGIPLMPHSMVFGHLEVIGKILGELPKDAHADYMMVIIKEQWRTLFPGCKQCPPVAYVDLWPFAGPMAITLDHTVSAQFTQDYSLPKAPQQKHVMHSLTRNRDLSSMEGPEWKLWRKRLNPGFSVQYITSRLPDLLEEISDFADSLRTRAGANGAWGPVFQLEELTTNLALDVILRFFLNRRLNEQSGQRSPLSTALIESISMSKFYIHIGNFLAYWSPYRQWKLARNYRVMTQCIAPFLHRRLQERRVSSKSTDRTLVDMIIKSLEEERGDDISVEQLASDPGFLELGVGQIVLFLFAGHDTTASTLCWAYRVLAQYPEVLARMRAEHDEVLGLGPGRAAQALSENPSLLNSLTYTHAVVKESMRVHTNVSTVRRGEAGFFLLGPTGSHYEGMRFPTAGFNLWDGTFAIHRGSDIWHRSDEFLPERFLTTDENDPLHPPKNAWRFFEMGPRNCIGQHLAVMEIKMALALTVRQFDVELAWDEWDAERNFKGKPETVWGDRCYQTSKGDMPPRFKDGMPVHVRLR